MFKLGFKNKSFTIQKPGKENVCDICLNNFRIYIYLYAIGDV